MRGHLPGVGCRCSQHLRNNICMNICTCISTRALKLKASECVLQRTRHHMDKGARFTEPTPEQSGRDSLLVLCFPPGLESVKDAMSLISTLASACYRAPCRQLDNAHLQARNRSECIIVACACFRFKRLALSRYACRPPCNSDGYSAMHAVNPTITRKEGEH